MSKPRKADKQPRIRASSSAGPGRTAGLRPPQHHNKLTEYQEKRAAFKSPSPSLPTDRYDEILTLPSLPGVLFDAGASPEDKFGSSMLQSHPVADFSPAQAQASSSKDYRDPPSRKSPTSKERHKKLKSTGDTNRVQGKKLKSPKKEMDLFPTPGSDLYDKIVNAGHSDPLRVWFKMLGLPCHPEKLEIESTRNPSVSSDERSDGQSQTEIPILESQLGSIATAPPDSIIEGYDDDGYESPPSYFMENTLKALPTIAEDMELLLGPEEEVVKQTKKRRKRDETASSLNEKKLNAHCNWVFSEFMVLEDDIEHEPSGAAIYDITFRYPRDGSEHFPHDIVAPPEPLELNGELLSLDRKVGNHLRHERRRMYDTRLPKLNIPEEWKNEVTAEEPRFYEIPERYRPYLPVREMVIRRAPLKCRLQATSDPGRGYDYVAVPADKKELAHAIAKREGIKVADPTASENAEVEGICQAFILENASHDDERRDITKALYKVLWEKNFSWHRHFSKEVVVRSLQRPELQPAVTWLPRGAIQVLNTVGCTGDTSYNEDTERIYEYPPYIIARFLAFAGNVEQMYSEGTVEKIIGGLLKGVIAGRHMNDRDNVPLPFPAHLKPVGTDPSPDVYVRATKAAGWHQSLNHLMPVLFAAECKPRKRLVEHKIHAQLATAFHSTLIILILYYLDTRESVKMALPPWLFLYGIEYTERGVVICAHHPNYDYSRRAWELVSKIVSIDYEDVFTQNNPVDRLRLLSVLFKIRSHSLFVLEQLGKWDRARAVLNVLLNGTSIGAEI